jgi:MFS family permease
VITSPTRALRASVASSSSYIAVDSWVTGRYETIRSSVFFSNKAGRAASWPVLKHRAFRIYFGSSLVSNLGTWLQNTAQLLLTYQLTHSAFDVGLITCAQFSGFLVVGPWAATLADRFGPTRVLVISQYMSAGIAAFLAFAAFSRMLDEDMLVAGALTTGLAFTFAYPLQTALAPRLVPDRDQDRKAALAMNSVSYNTGRAVAPLLCVVIVATLGAGWAFALNAASFVIFARTLALIHPGDVISTVSRTRIWSCFELAVKHPRTWLLLVMVTTATFADDPVLVLGPTLAHRVLAVSSTWPAYFLSALGIGTILGALVPTRPSTARLAAIPLLGLAVSIVVFASGVAPWLSLGAAVAAGVAALLTGAAAQALLQEVVGTERAPQVMALWAIAWAGSKPVASIADGWLASHGGLLTASLLLAGPALVVAVLELWLPQKAKKRLKDAAHATSKALVTIVTNKQQEPQPFSDESCGNRAVTTATCFSSRPRPVWLGGRGIHAGQMADRELGGSWTIRTPAGYLITRYPQNGPGGLACQCGLKPVTRDLGLAGGFPDASGKGCQWPSVIAVRHYTTDTSITTLSEAFARNWPQSDARGAPPCGDRDGSQAVPLIVALPSTISSP